MDFEQYHLPEWVNWVAQDASGTWWGYQVEPLENHHGWYENEVGRIIEICHDQPNLNWRDSLQRIS